MNAVLNDNCSSNQVRNLIQSHFGDSVFQSWFVKSNVIINDNEIRVEIDNKSSLQWIKSNYASSLEKIFKANFNISKVTLSSVKNNKLNEKTGNAIEKSTGNVIQIPRISNRKITNFIEDESNSYALSTINHLIKNQTISVLHGKILHISGPVSSGKTALIDYFTSHFDESKYIKYSTLEFITAYSKSVKNNTLNEFRDYILSKNFFILEDIHMLDKQKGTIAEIVKIANIFAYNGKIIITTGNSTIGNIPALSKEDPFCYALSTEIQEPSEKLRITFTKQKAVKHNIKIDDEKCIKIAKKSRNLKEIDSNIISLFTKSINGQNLKLFDTVFQVKSLDLSEKYISKTSEYFNVDKEKILSKSGGRHISLARYTAIYLLRKNTNMTMQEIASLFKLKSHTNVISAVKKIENNSEILTKSIMEIQDNIDN